jgi:outer membrane protein TolC
LSALSLVLLALDLVPLNGMAAVARTAVEKSLDVREALEGRASADRALELARERYRPQIVPSIGTNMASNSGVGRESNLNASVSLEQNLPIGSDILVVPGWTRGGGWDTDSLSVSVRQPLLRGRSPTANLRELRSAEEGVRRAGRALESAVTTVVMRAIRTGASIQVAFEKVRVLEGAESAVDKVVLLSETRGRAGLSTSMDVLRARFQAASVREERQSAIQELGIARESLRVQLDLEEGSLGEVSLETRSPPPPSRESAPERPELRNAHAAVREADDAATAAKQGMLPVLDLLAGLNYSRSVLPDGSRLPSQVFQFGFVGAPGDVRRVAQRAAYQEAEQASVRAKRTLRRVEQGLQEEVRNARARLERLEKSVVLQGERALQSEARAAIADARYRNGLADNFDLLEAATEERGARIALASAEADRVVAVHELVAARGGYLDWFEASFGLNLRVLAGLEEPGN